MRDLTQDSIVSHMVTIAVPITLMMVAQFAYQLVELYFVSSIGAAAIAGVNAAWAGLLLMIAVAQVLIVGTAALISHAAGRGDLTDANLVFNQSMMLSLVCGLALALLLYAFMPAYLASVAADEATVRAGTTYMFWVLPGFVLSLPMGVLSSSLRGIGLVRLPMLIYIVTAVINAVLAPVFISGWGTGNAFGVKGAGVATSAAGLVGIVCLTTYFHRAQKSMAMDFRLMRARMVHWCRILRIGYAAGTEYILVFLSTAIVYYTIRDFGASAQAGFGIGWRVLQALLLPGMSIALAAGTIAGQNFGARNKERVRETFRKAALIVVIAMTAIALLVRCKSTALVSVFDAEARDLAVAALFLELMSWTLAAQGLVHLCSTIFPALGNSLPVLIGSCARFVSFAIPALCLSLRADYRLEEVWYALGASVVLHGMINLWLLRSQFNKQLLFFAHQTNPP